MTRRELLAHSLRAAAAGLAAPMLNLGRCRLSAAGARREYSVRAVDLVGRSLVIDMLGLFTLDWKKLDKWHRKPSLFMASDFEALRSSSIDVFHPAVDLNQPDPRKATSEHLSLWKSFLSAHPDYFVPVSGGADLRSAKQSKRIAVLLGMQNSRHFRAPDDVDHFYKLGQRISQLTYNERNHIGSGCSNQESGLTEVGFQIVERMNHVGMAIDVSHAGDQTCFDTFSASSKPVLITHSNCRALAPHPRCKSDEVIKAMASTGGVMGITGVRAFVSKSKGSQPTIEDVLDHFDHVAKLVGIEHVGIGSDTGAAGRDAQPFLDVAGLNHSGRIYEIVEGLLARNYTAAHIESILGSNFDRALGHALG